MGRFREITPPTLLRNVVEAYWIYLPLANNASSSATIRVMPDGCIDLIGRLTVERDGTHQLKELFVCGATEHHSLFTIPQGTAWLGVRFRYGTASMLLGLHAVDLLDRQISVYDCNRDLMELTETMADKATIAEMFNCVSEFLIDRLQQNSSLTTQRTEVALKRLQQGWNISAIADDVGITTRTLHRDVLAASGMPPKLLARIVRFRKTLDLLKQPPINFARLAPQLGFADQAHMSREFREFAGISLREYRTKSCHNSPHV
jgi:AraC-like DNA-binding protein